MDNITWSKKSSATHDNGERNMCWISVNSRLPVEKGYYLVTISHEDSNKSKSILVWYDKEEFIWALGFNEEDVTKQVVAWMKLPTPYKPD